jgi:hypothetical protein
MTKLYRLLIAIISVSLFSCSNDNKPVDQVDSVSTTVQVEVVPARSYLYPYLKGNKWGYADSNATLVIKAQYDAVYEMVDGYAVVKKGDSLAILDSSGKEVTPFRYEYISNFKGKLAVFTRNYKHGIINGLGQEIVPPIYEDAETFENGIAVVTNDKKEQLCFNSEGTLLFRGYSSIKPNIYQPYFFVKNDKGKFGIIDKNDSIVVPFLYDWISTYNGWKKKYVVVVKDELYGMIDMNNNIILPFEYESLNYFEEMDLVVMQKHGKNGVCDLTGKTILAMKYDAFMNILSANAFMVSQNEKYGIVDSTGTPIVPLIYTYMNYRDGDLFSVRSEEPPGNDFWTGFINIKGDTIVPFGNYWSLYFQEGLASASGYVTNSKGKKERKYGFINRKGEVVVPYKYQYTHDFEHGVALVLSHDSLFNITKTGKEFREP